MEQQISEIDLVSRCKKGEEVAMRLLYDQLKPELMTVCRRYSRNDPDAKDVFQEGFARIINNIGRFNFRGEGSLRAWAVKIMVNESLMRLRKKGPEIFAEHFAEDIVDPEPEDVVKIPEKVLLKMISELPDGCRTVLNLFAFEKMKHDEIAAALGITKQTSSTQLMRARKLMAMKIKQYRQNEDKR